MKWHPFKLFLLNDPCTSLSILTAIFSGGPGLAGTRISLFVILLELRVMEVVVATGAIIRRAKLQSNRYHQQTKPTPNSVQLDTLPVVQPTVIKH